MRAFFLILLILPLAGCAHRERPYDGYLRNDWQLEQRCKSLQDEIALLMRDVSMEERANEVNRSHLNDRARKRSEAASRARSTYSREERDRDLREMIRILERQAQELRLELRAYRDGVSIYY